MSGPSASSDRQRAGRAPAGYPAREHAGSGRAVHRAGVGPSDGADAGARRRDRPPELERPLGRLPGRPVRGRLRRSCTTSMTSASRESPTRPGSRRRSRPSRSPRSRTATTSSRPTAPAATERPARAASARSSMTRPSCTSTSTRHYIQNVLTRRRPLRLRQSEQPDCRSGPTPTVDRSTMSRSRT